MNDFLQFVDRVPTLPNRKKITHEDNSVEYATIEYADEPIEEGTSLNKLNLNNGVANILGYNDVNVVKIPTETPTTTRINLQSNTTSNQGRDNSYSTNIKQMQDGDIIRLTYNLNGVALYGEMNYSWGPSVLNQVFDNTSYNSSEYVGIYYTTNKIYIDFGRRRHIKIYYRLSSAGSLACKYGDNSPNISWSPVSNSDATFEFDGRYLEIAGTSYQTSIIYYMYFDASDSTTTYQNQYTLNDFNFTNNKRVLIKTPANVEADSQTSTFNGIDLDANLSKNTFYELVYDQTQNIVRTNVSSVLYDITLEENVNQIDLIGISNLIKDDTLYLLQIDGGATTSGNFYFGNSTGGYLSTSGTSTTLFIKERGYARIDGIFRYSTTDIHYLDGSGILTNEYIKMISTSSKFKAGTHILIKEVA